MVSVHIFVKCNKIFKHLSNRMIIERSENGTKQIFKILCILEAILNLEMVDRITQFLPGTHSITDK